MSGIHAGGDVIDTAAAVRDVVRETQARLGLQQVAPKASDAPKARQKRAAQPNRTGPIWASVKIVRDHDTSPAVECLNCPATFCGGVTRIEKHILDKCTPARPTPSSR